MKKTMLTMLSVAMSASLSSFAATYTTGGFTFSYVIESGEAKLDKYSGANASVHIPSSFTTKVGTYSDGLDKFETFSVKTIGPGAFKNNKTITSVSWPSSLRKIDGSWAMDGAYRGGAFEGCTNLADIPSLSGIKEIGLSAFYGCASLKSVEIPSTVSSLGMSAFGGCTGLKTAFVDGAAIKMPSGLFGGCTSLESLVLGDGIIGIDGEFRGYVTYAPYPLSNCTNLKSVSLGRNISAIPASFMSGLPQVEKVSAAGTINFIGNSAFNGCTNLVEIPSLSAVTNIGSSAFYNCYKIPKSLDIEKCVKVGQSAFRNCVGISSVRLGEELASIDTYAFQGCTNASSFSFSCAPPSVGSSVFNNVKKDARGYYTAGHAVEWESVVDKNGYWNGLKMAEAKFTYSVTYKANGGSGNVARQSGEFGGGSIVVNDGGELHWEGHVFMGWAFAPDGEVVYKGGDMIAEPTDGDEVTLYAVWASPALTLAAESADWASGSITLRCEDADTSGSAHKYTLEYYNENGEWETAASNVAAGADGAAHLIDKSFSSRLGGLPPVRYRVMDENGRISPECETRRRRGLFVGVGHYKNAKKRGWDDLPEVETNARRYSSLAKDSGEFDVTTCIGSGATTSAVDAEFVELEEKVAPGDICLFFIATHGEFDRTGKAVVALYDDDYSDARLKKNIDRLADKDVAVVCILSACQSEAMLRQSRANVAVIAAANYQGYADDLFEQILMDYGWSEGWAGKSETLTFGELADYAAPLYNKLFGGIAFAEDGQTTTRSAEVDNHPLLEKITAGKRGTHGGLSAPGAISDFTATQATHKDKIVVSWSGGANADSYFVFYGGAGDGVYEGFEQAEMQTLTFKTNNYACVEYSSEAAPVPFAIRAFNKAGVSGTAFTNGWVSTMRRVTFDANGGAVDPWRMQLPVGGRVFANLDKGERLGDLPNATRDGFVFSCWFRENGLRSDVATQDTIVWDDVTYRAYWTDMTRGWLDAHKDISEAANGDIATAAGLMAANGTKTVGECYELGINPEDPDDDFKITHFEIRDGKPVITVNHTEDGSGESFESRMKTLGKKALTDDDWDDLTSRDQTGYHFFKITVDPK